MIEIITEGEGAQEFDYAPEPLFTVDGVEYTCPTRFSAADSIAYVDMIMYRGPEAATAWLLKKALGVEAFALIMHNTKVPDSAVNAIVEAVTNRMKYGDTAPKSPKASANGGSPTSSNGSKKKSAGSRSTPKKSPRTSRSSTG